MREKVIERVLASKLIVIVRGMAPETILPLAEALRPKMPVNLHLYDQVGEPEGEGEPGFIPSKRSFKMRLEHWIAGTQSVQ